MTTLLAAPRRAPAAQRARSPNRLALQITGRPYLSHTQIALMRACPRKFAFQYVDQTLPDFIPSSILFGGAIHAALELYFRARLEGLAATEADLLFAFGQSWLIQRQLAGRNVPVRFNKYEDEAKLIELAGRIIRAFLASPIARPQGTILAIEEEIRLALDPALPDVVAKLDLVLHTPDALHVIDFKTSRSRWSDRKAQEYVPQLVLYGQSVQFLARSLGLPVKLEFAVLTKAKRPKVQHLPLGADTPSLSQLTEDIARVWSAIRACNFEPTPSPRHCIICPFRSRCPVFAIG